MDKNKMWNEMDFSEKLKWNGRKGFLSGELFSQDNAFSRAEIDRVKRKKAKEQRRRLRKCN